MVVELGNIRYINDGTGSMAVFGNAISSTVKGDVIQATGTLSDYFGLLELSNITTWQLLSSGNNPPSPIVSTPLQLNENLESHLVQINGAVFTNAGGVFAGNANYAITANGESGQVRIAANTNLVGTTIPTGAVSIVAILSHISPFISCCCVIPMICLYHLHFISQILQLNKIFHQQD
ncbi:MAG: DUF5689 domain-containing protein [Bacteroidia bacterium]